MKALIVICIIAFCIINGVIEVHETPEEKEKRRRQKAALEMDRVLKEYKSKVGYCLVQQRLADSELYSEYQIEERNKYRWRRAMKKADEYIEQFEETGRVPEQTPSYINDASPICYEPKTSFARNLGM